MLAQQNRKLIVAGFTMSLLVACADGDKTKSASQIAARVNGDEISVHQLNYALSHTGLTREDQVKQATPQLLKRLVDRSVVMQQAKADKLDRDPAILLALEDAKRQVLSEAWLERHIQNIEKPTAQQVTEFNKAHPELFEKRKIYQLKELLIERTAENQQQIDQLLQTSADVNALAEKLDAQKIPYKVNQVTLAAEQLPMEHLSALYALPNGRFITVPNEKGQLIMGVLSTEESPLDAAKASLFIETFLVNDQRNKRAEAEVKRLRDAASIEYIGAFAALNQAGGNITAPKEVQPVKKPDPLPNDDSIAKGLTGLK